MANRNKQALEITERSRTSNGAKRSGQFELWVTYTTRLLWPGSRTYKVRRYKTREMAEKVGSDMLRKYRGLYTAFEVRVR